MEFEFKKITTNENLARLSELMFLCFGIKTDASYFQWKYFDDPAGPAIAYEAVYNGKTVGFYGLIPELYWINGAVKKIYQATDVMTHPEFPVLYLAHIRHLEVDGMSHEDFQRKGLFVTLSEMATKDALSHDKEQVLIAIPGSRSCGKFINKLNWKLMQTCNYIFLPSILFALKNSIKYNNNSSIIKFDGMNDMLFNYLQTMQAHTKVSKVINGEIFNWKIFNNPRFTYKVIGIVKNNELLGVCTYRVDYQHTCIINWLHFTDKINYKIYTPDFLKYIFKETKIKYVYTWKSKCGFLAEAYKKCGFLTNPFNKGPFNSKFPFIMYQEGSDTGNVLETFENYDFQPILLD
jgi:hypothetical protein